MRKEIYYVVKTDEGYKAPKGQFVKSLNRAVFYGTLKKAQETALFWIHCAKEKGNYALA